MNLSRRDYILKLIVEHFVKTAEPVGSVTLLSQYHLECSSATIRNEMAELEKMGFLEKTHTSSGRVPSADGYRYYIDNLRDKQLDETIKNQLVRILNNQENRLDDVIKESCSILSSMTNLTSFVMGSDGDKECLNKIQLVPLTNNSAVAVIVTTHGRVEYKTFNISESTSMEDIEKCINILNDRLSGTVINKVIDKMEALRPILSSYIERYDVFFKTFVDTFVNLAKEDVSVYGQDKIFDQPEFNTSTNKIKKVFKLMENDDLFNLVKEQDKKINILFGDDLDEDLDDVSIVTTKINVKDEVKTIALLGPSRMDYQRVIGAMEYLADQIDTLFNSYEEDIDE